MLRIQHHIPVENQEPTENESAALELASIQGEKNRLQAEIDGIIINKKRIQDDIDAESKKAEKLFLEDKEKKEQELKEFITYLENAKGKKVQLESEIAELLHDISDAKRHISEHAEKLENARKDILVENTNHNSHKKINESLKKDIESLNKDISALQQKKSSLSSEISDKEKKSSLLEQSSLEIVGKILTLESKDKVLQESIKRGSEVVLKNGKDLIESEINLTDIKKQVIDSQRVLLELKSEIEKEKKQSTQRMGDLSRLEERVEEKIQILKDAKKEFTTEHLIRMGIKD